MTTIQHHSIISTIKAHAVPESEAIAAPNLKPITYTELLNQVAYFRLEMNRLGIRPTDRVGIVLPNGPWMISVFLGIITCAVAAPLNPTYRDEEFDFYLSDLNTKLLIVMANTDSPSRKVAERRKIPIIELVPSLEKAGQFILNGKSGLEPCHGFENSQTDTCLMLHTSGTTARPKIVALTQHNLQTSALNIAKSLQLSSNDRCLNVMPLFHIHGLIGATLSTLLSGGCVIATPGPRFPDFFYWLDQLAPSWYTAVPTIHQSVLQEAEAHREIVSKHRLRLIRSCSSALPAEIMHRLEAVFRVPVIEAYGMTEGSHQIASNPLPPARRKPLSVGLPSGPQVSIIDSAGNPVASGVQGEVAIIGESVIHEYYNSPEANQTSFHSGWLKTGDIGYLDQDGYLFLVGRSKEIINQGGEKISPREIDEVLMRHPSVSQAVTFAMPHPRLGECVAAAVVLKAGKSDTEIVIRDFARTFLADFKVPVRILIINEIPKGPTGKIQRIGLYEKLKPHLQVGSADQKEQLENQIAALWKKALRLKSVDSKDNFFSLGGDSLLAIQMIASAKSQGIIIDPGKFFRDPVLSSVASASKLQEKKTSQGRILLQAK